METKINISRQSVYDRVAHESVYFAGRAQGADEQSYDRLLVTEEDKQLLDTFFADAISSVSALLREYLVSVTTPGLSPASRGDATIVLSAPNNCTLDTYNVDTDIARYVQACVLADYLTRLGELSAKAYEDEAEGLAKSITTRINARRRIKHADMCEKGGAQ